MTWLRRPVPTADAASRPAAAGPTPDPLMVAYHDEEWGTPVHDDIELFERLALESFQAGLVVVDDPAQARRRSGRRSAASIRPSSRAFGEADRARLMADAGIVRNGAKIDATVGNAVAVPRDGARLRVVRRLSRLDGPAPAGDACRRRRVGRHPGRRRRPRTRSRPTSSRRGFRFVGSTIVYAFMQSVGLVDDHLAGCFRYRG